MSATATASAEDQQRIHHGSIIVPATNELFIAKHRIPERRAPGEKRANAYMGVDFVTDFSEKLEEPLQECSICYGTLSHRDPNLSIIDQFCGQGLAETKLTHVFWLADRQPTWNRIDPCVLLANGFGNCFCVRNVRDEFRLVLLRHIDARWSFQSYKPDEANRLGDVRRFFRPGIHFNL